MNEEKVVLVNESGEEIGLMPKLEAHKKGILHKAISVIIFNDKGELLLQQRAMNKYHWSGVWSNACCTHPRESESYQEAANRRLFEELGFYAQIKDAFSFIYKAEDASSGLIEHELDHVFIGYYNGEIAFNIKEVMAVKWLAIEELNNDLQKNPLKYSFWFHIIWEELQNRKLL